MIRLIDRRFVPFYFNRSGQGEGGDEQATTFVAGRTRNPYAFFAAFKPTGELVGETELDADKGAVLAWLQGLLARHPEFAAPTGEEQVVLASGGLAGAQLAEDLADYADAAARYRNLLQDGEVAMRARAVLGLLRIARHGAQWRAHEVAEELLRQCVTDGASRELSIDADVERGHRLLASGEFAAARALLQPLCARAAAAESRRLAEAHFAAGRACWLSGDRDWAKLHWGWIVDRLPEDRLYMRARIAAAAEGMPYPNAELDGFAAGVGDIGTQHIVDAVDAAMAVHRQLLPFFAAGEYTAAPPAATAADTDDPAALVAQMCDGDDQVHRDDAIVTQLAAIGAPAVAVLIAALEDREFPGRGHAAWALSQVLKAAGLDHAPAIAALEKARDDADPHVAESARSGLSTLGRAK